MSSRSELEDHEINHLKRLIRETPMRVDLVEQTMKRVDGSSLGDEGLHMVEETRTMKRIDNSNLRENRSNRNNRNNRDNGNNRTHRKNVLRSVMIAVATAAVIFFLVMGTRFISPPMTASKEQVLVNGTIFQYADDLGLRTADEKGLVTTLDLSVTHDGVTLKIPAVVYDGTRVSIGIERQTADSIQLKKDVLGNITSSNLSINGEFIQSYAPTGHSLGPYMNLSKNKNIAFLQIFDSQNLGGKAFPDQFELTLTIRVAGILEPFKFNISVKKITKDIVDITPSVTRKYENISMTLEKVEITPITTNISTRIKLPEYMKISSSIAPYGFAIYDDKGNELKGINSEGIFPTGTVGNVSIADFRFEPFKTIPKSITIKMSKLILKKDDQTKFELDENGKEKRMYFPALDITLPITKAE